MDDSKTKFDNFQIQYFYDEEANLSIEQIQNIPFRKTTSNQFTHGYKDGNAWFKIELINQSSTKDFILHFSESLWSVFDMYIKENNTWKISKNGLQTPLEKRDVKNIFPSFKLSIPQHEKSVIYLKGHTISGQIGHIEIFTENDFFNTIRFNLTDLNIYFLIIFITLIFINIYNMIITRDKIYIYYLAYLLSIVLFIGVQSGVYLLFNLPGWNQGLHVVGAIVIILLLLFSNKFLQLKTRIPHMYNYFIWMSTLIFILILMIAFDIKYSSQIFNVVSVIAMSILFYTTIKLLLQGFKEIKYYLMALLICSVSIALLALTFNTILPYSNIYRYAFLIGFTLEVLFFTLILTNRFVETNKEKIKAQNALLKEKQNKEQELQTEIQRQTHSLSVANKKLLEQTKELEIIQEKLTKEATVDVLSNLNNRRYFFKMAHKEFSTAKRYKHALSMILIDIDNFKQINDTYGHMFGDEIIQFVSKIFQEMSRNSDTVARYGGEEFIFLLPETKKHEAAKLAERIRTTVEERGKVAYQIKRPLTITLGVTELENDDIDIEKTILRCDKALYEGKANGRNVVNIS